MLYNILKNLLHSKIHMDTTRLYTIYFFWEKKKWALIGQKGTTIISIQKWSVYMICRALLIGKVTTALGEKFYSLSLLGMLILEFEFFFLGGGITCISQSRFLAGKYPT